MTLFVDQHYENWDTYGRVVSGSPSRDAALRDFVNYTSVRYCVEFVGGERTPIAERNIHNTPHTRIQRAVPMQG